MSLRTVVICKRASTSGGEEVTDTHVLNSAFTDPGDQFIG